jgi:hypothetical protein
MIFKGHYTNRVYVSVTKKEDLKQKKQNLYLLKTIYLQTQLIFFHGNLNTAKKRCGQKKKMDGQQTPFINNVKKKKNNYV